MWCVRFHFIIPAFSLYLLLTLHASGCAPLAERSSEYLRKRLSSQAMSNGMSGLDAIARIRSAWTAARLPIVVLTASDDIGILESCMKLGCADYLRKARL